MDTEILFTLAIAIFLGFYVQTIVGFAGALIALPILLLKLEFADAVTYISIFYLFSSIFLVSKEWKNMDKKILMRLALASLVGVLIGIAVLMFAKPLILKKALGIFILFYVGYSFFGKKKVTLNNIGVYFVGVMAGFFSGVFTTGGPLYVMCVENTVKDVKALRATMIGVLGMVTIARIPALALGGILNMHHIQMALCVFPIFLLAQYLGKRTFLKMDETVFKRSLLALLCISGSVLIF